MRELYVVCANWKDAKEHIALVKEHGLEILKVEETDRGTIRIYY